MCKNNLPIDFKAELKNIVKDYYLGKWVFTEKDGFKRKFYKKVVYMMWKMA